MLKYYVLLTRQKKTISEIRLTTVYCVRQTSAVGQSTTVDFKFDINTVYYFIILSIYVKLIFDRQSNDPMINDHFLYVYR